MTGGFNILNLLRIIHIYTCAMHDHQRPSFLLPSSAMLVTIMTQTIDRTWSLLMLNSVAILDLGMNVWLYGYCIHYPTAHFHRTRSFIISDISWRLDPIFMLCHSSQFMGSSSYFQHRYTCHPLSLNLLNPITKFHTLGSSEDGTYCKVGRM